MGQEDALRRKPEKDLCNKRFIIDSVISLDRKSKIYIHDILMYVFFSNKNRVGRSLSKLSTVYQYITVHVLSLTDI